MKNKKLTYFLLFLVVLLWGYLIYKVFGAVSGNSEHIVPTTSAPAPVDDLDYYKFKNRDSLLLSYRDPLYTKINSQPNVVPETAPVPVAPPVPNYAPVPVVHETIVNYTGFIENELSQKRVAIVNIDNKQYMISTGETQDGIQILEIQKEQIRIKYKGKTKTIYK